MGVLDEIIRVFVVSQTWAPCFSRISFVFLHYLGVLLYTKLVLVVVA